MSSLKAFFPITNEEKMVILAKYNKTESDVSNDVTILKEWLKKQPHIPHINVDDFFLEVCHLRNKFRIEKTKLKIDKYFSSKNTYSEIFQTLDPWDTDIVNATDFLYAASIPKLSPKHSRIAYGMLNLSKKVDFKFDALYKLMTINLENAMVCDYTDSMIFVLDGAGFTMSMVTQLEIRAIATIIKLYQDSFSSRIEAIHVLNMAYFAEVLLNISKPLIPPKLRDKIIFHSNETSIFDYLPKECLPEEIGGTGPSAKIASKEQFAAVQQVREYILQRNITGTNESLRIGAPTVDVENFGNEGTFRKIEID